MSELNDAMDEFQASMESLGEMSTAIYVLDRYVSGDVEFSGAAHLLYDGDLIAQCGLRRLQLTALVGRTKRKIEKILEDHPDLGLWVLKELSPLDDQRSDDPRADAIKELAKGMLHGDFGSSLKLQ